MIFFAAHLSGRTAQSNALGVLVEKEKDTFTLREYHCVQNQDLARIAAGKKLKLSIDEYDLISSKQEIPLSSDPSTRDIIIKNKLKEDIDQTRDYLSIQIPLNEKSSNPKTKGVFETHIITQDTFFNDIEGYEEKQQKITDLFTVSQCALAAMSSRYFDNEATVFHSYADNEKIIITVTKGKNIIYNRISSIEADVDNYSKLTDMYYENINLTYMYAKQNLRIKIDNIVLSGRLSENLDLAKIVFEFTEKPLSVLMPGKDLKNCTSTQFQDFLLPIASLFCPSVYDFLPVSYKRNIGFKALVKVMNIAALFVVLGLFYINIHAGVELVQQKDTLENKSNSYTILLSRLVTDKVKLRERQYMLKYITLLDQRKNTPVKLMIETKELLDIGKYSRMVFESSKDKKTVIFKGEYKSLNIPSKQQYIEDYNNSVKKAASNTGLKVQDSTKHNLNTLISTIDVKLSTEDSGNKPSRSVRRVMRRRN